MNVITAKKSGRVLLYIFLIATGAAFLAPIIIVFYNSFKGKLYISDDPFALPNAETFSGIENYIGGIEKTGFPSAFGWSLFITVFSVAAIVLFTSMTAWYIVRVKNKFTKALYYIFVFSMIVPFQMVMFTMTKTVADLGLDNPWGLIIVYLGFGAGLAVFMFCGFVKSVPLEIEEAAMIDGCGKSTTLRMIAGLEHITKGELKIGDRIVNDVAPKDRDIAMVFQSYALYPHMTVYKNMAFGLELRKMPKDEIDKRVREAARVLDIEHLLKRKPKALSGGQRQRVALGRAMVRSPSVFLLDEPLSNLDAKLRTNMRTEIKKLHQRLGTTFIYVTHDQTEAMTMGDRIVVMKDGVIQQVDSPQNLYKHPQNMFVAGFIGSPQMNFLDAELKSKNGKIFLSLAENELDVTDSFAKTNEIKEYFNKSVKVGIRPEDVTVDNEFIIKNPDKVLTAKLEVSELMGSESYLYLDYSGQKLTARVAADSPANETVELGILTDRIHLFDPNSTSNIIKN